MPLYIEPNAGPAPIVRIINQARRQVDVGVYYLSDRPILR
ncbi:MAG: GTP-binding protein, partial [Acidithiobacillus caldus]|nr:GTP-binding protein [Acidithiobacillus caldus]